jgi:hypothetical protein
LVVPQTRIPWICWQSPFCGGVEACPGPGRRGTIVCGSAGRVGRDGAAARWVAGGDADADADGVAEGDADGDSVGRLFDAEGDAGADWLATGAGAVEPPPLARAAPVAPTPSRHATPIAMPILRSIMASTLVLPPQ